MKSRLFLRYHREMPRHHLPAIGSLNEDDGESEFRPVLNFWYSAPGSNCGVAKNAHLNVQPANSKTVAARTFSWYDICLGKSISPWSGTQKIIGNDSV